MLTPSEIKTVQGYLEKIASLTRERIRTERQLERYEATLRSMLLLHDEKDVAPYLEQLEANTKPEGFTEAIRRVLRSSKAALTPTEVKERLPGAGFDLEGYGSPLASIHTILKRLARTDSVNQVSKSGKTAYQWALPKSEAR